MEEILIEENELSIHTLYGSVSYSTINVKGKAQRKDVIMLVDSGSTHDFIDINIVKDIRFFVIRTNLTNVIISNRDRIISQAICERLT